MTARLDVERVTAAEAPDAPAVGVHYWLGERYGFIPEPPGAGAGLCWWGCGKRIGALAPLCNGCARLCWGDELLAPAALARHALTRPRRWSGATTDVRAAALGSSA